MKKILITGWCIFSFLLRSVWPRVHFWIADWTRADPSSQAVFENFVIDKIRIGHERHLAFAERCSAFIVLFGVWCMLFGVRRLVFGIPRSAFGIQTAKISNSRLPPEDGSDRRETLGNAFQTICKIWFFDAKKFVFNFCSKIFTKCLKRFARFGGARHFWASLADSSSKVIAYSSFIFSLRSLAKG